MCITEKENRFIIANSFLGGMMMYYDFIIYLLLSPILTQILFNSNDFYYLVLVNTIFAVTYAVSLFGGILAAHFGDRTGRRKILIYSIFIMAFSTVYIGTLPSFLTLGKLSPVFLVILRIFQGLAIGAELPGNVAVVYEISTKNKKVLNSAFIFVGVECGILMALWVYVLINAFLTNEQMLTWGWRPPFLFGAILTAIVWSMRVKNKESAEFIKLVKDRRIIKIPLILFLKKYYQEFLISFLLVLGGFSIFISLFGLFLPNILITAYSYTKEEAYTYSIFFMLIYIFSTILAAFINQKYSRMKIRIAFVASGIMILCSFVLLYLTSSSFSVHKAFILCIVCALCMGIVASITPSIIASLFPIYIRFTGIAASYNIAQAVGGGIIAIIFTTFLNISNIRALTFISLLISTISIFIALFFLFLKTNNQKSTLF